MSSVHLFLNILLIVGISSEENFFSFKGKDIKGNDVDFSEFKGKSGCFFKCTEIGTSDSNEVHVRGDELPELKELYVKPYKSGFLNIYLVPDSAQKIQIWHMSAVDKVSTFTVQHKCFRGHTHYTGVTLVVNSASQCSQTEPHLKALKRLHDILSFGKSFNVVTFPSNDFGDQEPWEEPEIEEYYRGHFKVEFPIMQKTKIVGQERTDLWSWISKTSIPPAWNFHKYLINGKGKIVKNWPAETSVENIFDNVKNLVDATIASEAKDFENTNETGGTPGDDREEL